MFQYLKVGGVWQAWNVTCDGSIIVENFHRNMGFFKTLVRREAKALINVLKGIRPAFSLNEDFTKVVLDSDLEKNPQRFHVFDYLQLQEERVDIGDYVRDIDFRLGSFVVYREVIFKAVRILDELDTFPGRQFLCRHLEGQKPAPIDPKGIFEIVIPSRKDVRSELLVMNQGFIGGKYQRYDQRKLREEIKDYVDTYCYPSLDLKIPVSRYRKARIERKAIA
jgi:hypothetical protein